MANCTVFRSTAAAFVAVIAGTSLAWAQPSSSPPVRQVELVVPRVAAEALSPVRLESVRVTAELVGSVAKSTVELSVHNPNNRVLEGELRFPLLDNQTVTGFAPDIAGAMRAAVPVPKDKGRQVFDDVTRQGVDPALLQATQGNNYSLRVYPIPAHGSRRVRLEIAQSLDREAGALVYRLPTTFAGRIGRFDAAVRVTGADKTTTVSARIGSGTPLESRGDSTGAITFTHSQQAYEGGGMLVVSRAPLPGVQVSAEVYGGQTYFYAELPEGADSPMRRPAPQRLGIVWDASGSAQAAGGRQLELLGEYLRRLRHARVVLRVVRDIAEEPQVYVVRNGNWDVLKARLSTLTYDGGTSAELLAQAPSGVDQVLVFTDGLLNFGRAAPVAPLVPTMTIKASVSADATLLRHFAERSGGEYIDLSRASVEQALQRLLYRRARIVDIQGRGAGDVVTVSPYAIDGAYRIGGVLNADAAVATVTIEDPRGVRRRRDVAIAPAIRQDGEFGIAAQQWAAMKLADLRSEPRVNQGAIERLGLRFRMVTPRTSLIVLDAARDYVRYQIEPPVEDRDLTAEVQALAAVARTRMQTASAEQLARVTREFEARLAWWERDFPKDAPPVRGRLEQAPTSGTVGLARDQRQELHVPPPAPMSAPAMISPTARAPVAAAAAAPAAARKSSGGGGATSEAATIRLQKWAPDSVYARRMRAAAADEVYRVYLDERPAHLDSTAFFLDAADILAEKNLPTLAARVVSNLAEMNLENRQIMRILAYRLTQMKAHAAAIAALERVVDIAPDEPQSWRDLALAQADAGQIQVAVDNLWRVVSTPWSGRFPHIEIVALTELNAIVARAHAANVTVDTSAIAPALLRHMPLGLRVTLAWDADNTDIDLHVVDPNGEEAYFGRRLTYQGAAMSPDFTGGYGPEEFALKVAKPGRYTVRARFYGHNQQIVAPSTTLMMELTTDFGTPRQQSRNVVLRLSGRSQMADVGEFEVATGEGAR